jgi:hypothetical protein
MCVRQNNVAQIPLMAFNQCNAFSHIIFHLDCFQSEESKDLMVGQQLPRCDRATGPCAKNLLNSATPIPHHIIAIMVHILKRMRKLHEASSWFPKALPAFRA